MTFSAAKRGPVTNTFSILPSTIRVTLSDSANKVILWVEPSLKFSIVFNLYAFLFHSLIKNYILWEFAICLTENNSNLVFCIEKEKIFDQ